MSKERLLEEIIQAIDSGNNVEIHDLSESVQSDKMVIAKGQALYGEGIDYEWNHPLLVGICKGLDRKEDMQVMNQRELIVTPDLFKKMGYVDGDDITYLDMQLEIREGTVHVYLGKNSAKRNGPDGI